MTLPAPGLWNPHPSQPWQHPLHPPHDLPGHHSGVVGIAQPARGPVAPQPIPAPIAIPVGPRHALRRRRNRPARTFHLVISALARGLGVILGWPLAAWHRFAPKREIGRIDYRGPGG
jgi:hypothetical protein